MHDKWSARREPLIEQDGAHLTLLENGRAMTWAEVLSGWREDESFRDVTIDEFASTTSPAFFWEMPPVRANSVNAVYECVLLSSAALATPVPNPSAFAAQFAAAPLASVLAFQNLGGDANLIVPRSLAPNEAYAHLAAFSRAAPAAQQHELLRVLATVFTTLLSPQPLWLSTAGLGVPWLHVRLDKRPKYFRYRRFREADTAKG